MKSLGGGTSLLRSRCSEHMGIVLALVVCTGIALPCSALEVYSGNPFYWQHQGKPVLLLGASGDDTLFQWAGAEFGDALVEHLDLLVSVGGNYVRNTMSSRNNACSGYNDDKMAYPFRKLDSGKYDLEYWNDDYWRRLESFLVETAQRGIFVQLEIWDLYAILNDQAWAKQPWNPTNNVNYTYESTLLERGRSGVAQPFFNAVLADRPDAVLRRHQDRYIRKMLDITMQFGHVLYQIDNESPLAAEISDYWARLIHAEAAARGRTAYVCDSRRFHAPSPYVTTTFQDWHNPDIHRPILNPGIYNFCDISQNGGNTGQQHYENLLWYRSRLEEHTPRPINHVKIYRMIWPTGKGWRERIEPDEDFYATRRFWRTIFGGAASARHHRDKCGYGLGLGPRGQADVKSMRMLTDEMDLFTMEPSPQVLHEREENEAYALAETGSQYAVYFTGVGDRKVEIDLKGTTGVFSKRWLNIESSSWRTATTLIGGGRHLLTPPGPGEWAVLLKATKAAMTSNPKASPTARAILDYLYSLSGRSDKRILSGQFLDHGTNANLDEITEVYDKTGHWVSVVGGDYYGRSHTGAFVFNAEEWTRADWKVTNPLFLEYWNQGGLVTLCLHAVNPQTGNSSWMLRNKDTVNLMDIVTPGRPGYDAWIRELDRVAEGLKELADAGVVVLFRPFHEMNGEWFWWGSRNPPDHFVKLWRHTFNYLTHKKRLDNLLWVYSPGSGSRNYLKFYPGDQYVDIVGIDAYERSPTEIRDGGYNMLITTGKPFGLTEYGPYRQLNIRPDQRFDFDYGKFIDEMVEQMPMCSFFWIWHQNYGLQAQRNAKEGLEHPWVVNRADLPELRKR